MDCKRLQCQGCIPSRQNERSILYNLLAAPPSSVTMETDGTFIQTAENSSSRVSTHHHYCHHYLQHTKALLKYPDIVQQEAAQLLLKTIDFTKNLPIYWDLDHNDRVQLYLHGWAEMLVLTMAQYKFDFEITEQSYESHEQSTPHAAQDRVKFDTSQQGIPVWGDVKKINNFLQRCHHLQIDDKEYAYLKSTILFNAESPSLNNPYRVEEYQSETQLRLNEYVTAMYPNDPLRFARILLCLPTLRNIKAQVLIELFFRPLIGEACMDEVLETMLQQ